LLVAPADVERPPARRPCVRADSGDLLPFPSQVVSSDNDAAVSAPRRWSWQLGREAGILAVPGTSM
jgi:predicted alpha/beta hydrolase family esterase